MQLENFFTFISFQGLDYNTISCSQFPFLRAQKKRAGKLSLITPEEVCLKFILSFTQKFLIHPAVTGDGEEEGEEELNSNEDKVARSEGAYRAAPKYPWDRRPRRHPHRRVIHLHT